MGQWARVLLATTVVVLSSEAKVSSAELYVSHVGSDDNTGTLNQPLRTIQKAADTMNPGDTCYVRRGVYRETVTIKRPGATDKPIRFTAYPGETVVLSGADPIKCKWSAYGRGIYETRVNQEVSQLFVSGQMMVEARWPNQPLDRRWDKNTWRPTADGSEYGRIVDPELAGTGIDWTDALAVLNVGAWQTFLRRVRNHGAGNASFVYDKDLGLRHEAERTREKRTWAGFDHYFLFGKLEALDSPGEWFLDRKTKTLYLWPLEQENPSPLRIEAKTREYAFVVQGQGHVQLDGFQFFATAFIFEDTENCVIQNCKLDYPTYAGPSVKLDGSTPFVPKQCQRSNQSFLGGLRTLAPTLVAGQRNVVRNCTFAFSEAPGVLLEGSENVIENCLVHDIDWRGLGNGVAGNCAGVHMGGSARSVFRRNTVHHIGSSEGVILPGMGPFVCEFNYIHHGGLVQCDGGLLQCHGIKLHGAVIRYNWVHDHQAFHWGGIGIRGDDLTRNLIVHHNVVWNCNEKGIMIKGDHNQVYNNSCFNNPQLDLVLWSAPEPLKEWASGQWPHLIKQQNANSKACNNYAPVLTGQMPHEVRRAGKVELPVCELSHNLGNASTTLVDAKELIFRKQVPPLADPAVFDFRPKQGSAMIDAGREIAGITDGYVGKAPDIGAYEYGADTYWMPGYQAPHASMPVPPTGAENVRTDIDLAWLGGYQAVSHDVYVGTEARSVADANRKSKAFRGNQETNIFAPSELSEGMTYYWRIDTVTPTGTLKGQVWHFKCALSP